MDNLRMVSTSWSLYTIPLWTFKRRACVYSWNKTHWLFRNAFSWSLHDFWAQHKSKASQTVRIKPWQFGEVSGLQGKLSEGYLFCYVLLHHAEVWPCFFWNNCVLIFVSLFVSLFKLLHFKLQKPCHLNPFEIFPSLLLGSAFTKGRCRKYLVTLPHNKTYKPGMLQPTRLDHQNHQIANGTNEQNKK